MAGMPIFCDPDKDVAEALREECGGIGVVFHDLGSLRDHLMVTLEEDTIVLGTNISDHEAFAVADYLRLHRPSLGVILVRDTVTTPLLQEALRAGLQDVLHRRDTLGLQSAIKRSAHLAAARRDHTPEPSSLTPAPPEQPAPRGRI